MHVHHYIYNLKGYFKQERMNHKLQPMVISVACRLLECNLLVCLNYKNKLVSFCFMDYTIRERLVGMQIVCTLRLGV